MTVPMVVRRTAQELTHGRLQELSESGTSLMLVIACCLASLSDHWPAGVTIAAFVAMYVLMFAATAMNTKWFAGVVERLR